MQHFHHHDDAHHAENLARIFGGPDGVAHAKARLAKIGPKLMAEMREATETGHTDRLRSAARDLVGALSLFQGDHVIGAVEEFAIAADPFETGRTAALYNDMAARFDLLVSDPQFLGDSRAKSMFAALQADI